MRRPPLLGCCVARAAGRLVPLVLLAWALFVGPIAPGDPATRRPGRLAHAGEEGPAAATRLVPRRWLALEAVDARGRRPFRSDAVFRAHLLDPDAAPPRAGETLRGALTAEAGGRTAAWRPLEASEDGGLETTGLGYAYAALEVEEGDAGVWMADLRGAAALFVGGTPHAGDLYGLGGACVPVELVPGTNHVLVTGFRGRCSLSLRRPPAPCFVDAQGATLPDLVREREAHVLVGVRVVNASREAVAGLRLVVTATDPGAPEADPPAREEDQEPGLLHLAPLSVGRAWARVRVAPAAAGTTVVLRARLEGGGAAASSPHVATLCLRVVDPGAARQETFLSAIDASVQAYALLPPRVRRPGAPLMLTLHGAGVDALGHARAYARKHTTWIVAPTNRGRFGFDWQDWGRLDAYEALDEALGLTGAHPRRVHLTGHSMGGHGAWHLAVNDPDRFASVSPAAAWISFDSYGGRPDGPLTSLWRLADPASETLRLAPNLVEIPVRILHGTADDNVPVTESHRMEARLREVGARDVKAWYAEGRGHWWRGDGAEGVACVDWPAFFQETERGPPPGRPERIAFVSAAPSVDAVHHWVRVEQALEPGEPLAVEARYDVEASSLVVATRNVRHLALDPPCTWSLRRVHLDGQRLVLDRLPLAFVRTEGRWSWSAASPPPDEQRAARSGPFKRAFGNRFVLVHGTQGDATETRALRERAGHDASLWAYRAGGAAPVLADRAFLADPRPWADRNVILYGNADTNAAWSQVLPETCPLHLERGRARVAGRTYEGDGLAALFVFPRRDSDVALVGVVGDTGWKGARLGLVTAIFVSGVGYPDFVLYGPEVLERADDGVRTGGFFDPRWALPPAGD